jgi:DNA replication protein DnaC
MGQAMDLQEANQRLLQKRAQLNQTELRGQPTGSIDFNAIAAKCLSNIKPEPEVKLKAPKRAHINGLPVAYKNCTFESYHGNDKLIKDLKKLITVDADGIVLRGNTGCGKTHLAIALAKHIPTEDRFSRSSGEMIHGTIFTTAPELLLKIRSAFRDDAKQSEEQLIDYYSGCELLILDDLGSEKTSEFAVTTLYVIIDRRLRDCKKTIITTNMSQPDIEQTFGARIASRLSGMENIKINMPDHRKVINNIGRGL